jgi:hypothetical protein
VAESKHDIAAAMYANALIANTGSREKATERAMKAFFKQTEPEGQLIWMKTYHMLRSGEPIPPHRTHIPEIPTGREVHYQRIECFARGGAVGSKADDDGDGDKATKQQAAYSPYGSEEKHCSICSMFREPNSCTEVQGDISRTAICDYFEGKGLHYERVPIRKRDDA